MRTPKHVVIARTQGAEAGFAAYCASVTSGQGMSLEPVRAKAESILGKRLNPERKGALAAYCKAFDVDASAEPQTIIREAKGETPQDLAQIIAELQARIEALAAPAASGRTPRTRPTDAASNGVLWRLNVEGLLAEALDASDEDYITQDAGTTLLTATFGPQ